MRFYFHVTIRRNTNADEDEGLEKRRIQIHKELEAMRTSNKTRPLSTRHRESGAVNYQSPCSQSSRSRWSSSSSSSSSGSGSYSSSSSGSCSRSGSSCSSARLNRKKSRKSTMRRPLDTSDASLRLSKRVSKTIGYTPPLSSSKDPVQVSPIDCRSRTPQSNSSSYYSRKSHALSPATPSQRSTHSQSPLPGSSTVFNKSNSLKFDRHGNIRVSLRDKERQRRAVPTYNVPTNSPLVSNNMILNRIVTSSPIFRPLSNSPQKSIEPQASSVATTKNVAPPPYLEQINRELNEKRLQENCNGRIQSSPKSTGEMSPISNCSLFGDEDAGKGIDLEDAEPGEILDMVNDASKIAGDRSLDSTRSSLKMHKDGAVIPNEPQNFSDWSDADDILDEIKQKSDEQLETISDDEFDPSMVEDLNRDGARDQLSGKQVLDILDIDWKSLVESKEKLEFVPGSARKRFLPGNVFAHIGISERLAGSTLIERVKQLCQQQSVDTFHTFHHPTGFLHRAIRRQSIAKACQDSGSFAFGSDLKYKQFLSTGRSVRLPLQRLLQPQSLQGRNNDSSNLIDKSVGTIDACE